MILEYCTFVHTHRLPGQHFREVYCFCCLQYKQSTTRVASLPRFPRFCFLFVFSIKRKSGEKQGSSSAPVYYTEHKMGEGREWGYCKRIYIHTLMLSMSQVLPNTNFTRSRSYLASFSGPDNLSWECTHTVSENGSRKWVDGNCSYIFEDKTI